jgi:hypothetical protein
MMDGTLWNILRSGPPLTLSLTQSLTGEPAVVV